MESQSICSVLFVGVRDLIRQSLGTERANPGPEELHLTKVTGLVQMRPQFHHLDASSHVESAARRREREAAEPPRDTQPRAVQMSVKQNDTDSPTGITTKDYLQAAQQEPWTKLRYHDEDVSHNYSVLIRSDKRVHI